MDSLEAISKNLQIRDNYLLVSHAIPDGDSIGSILGLYLALQGMGKKAEMLLKDPVPPIYNYLCSVDRIKAPYKIESVPANVIYLDCSDEERVGEDVAELLSSRLWTVNIDHHATNNMFGDLNYVRPEASATAEILFDIISLLPVEITPGMAECLYAGIIMDSGRFMNSNTTGVTMRVAAALLDKGASVERARNNLFESKPREEVLLLRQALQNIEFNSDGRIAWMLLPYKDIMLAGAGDLHPEGIINYTRMIEGVEVGMLFREVKPGLVKVGFRSRGSVDVSLIAGIFGGGGHKLASGARLEGELEEVRDIIVNQVEDVLASCMDS